MKVWAVYMGYDYEEGWIEGVASSYEKAEEIIRNYKRENTFSGYTNIIEFTVV